jgi:hypothetical protein
VKTLLLSVGLIALAADPTKPPDLAKVYVEAVRELNEKHARAPGKETEEELAKKLPAAATKALEGLLAAKPSEDLGAALESVCDAAADLDRAGDFDRIRARLAELEPARADQLDRLLSRPRFVLRGENGVGESYLEGFARVFDGILDAYDEVFGFEQWSKVPGKKLRVRVHRVDAITAPPHFAPEFPYHSEIDFPVADVGSFSSPTADGKFLFYGLCHELGHVIAMWGDPRREADHHAWAHYTGVAIVEHLSSQKDAPDWMKPLRDVQWRSLAKEREAAKDVEPSLEKRENVLALLLALHERLGPRAIGEALNRLDREDRRLCVNRVRYYEFADLKTALLAATKAKERVAAIRELLP